MLLALWVVFWGGVDFVWCVGRWSVLGFRVRSVVVVVVCVVLVCVCGVVVCETMFACRACVLGVGAEHQGWSLVLGFGLGCWLWYMVWDLVMDMLLVMLVVGYVRVIWFV